MIAVLAVLLSGPVAVAHVPYLERVDFSPDDPFVVAFPTQSIAVYSWIAVEEGTPADDVDVYRLELDEATEIFVESIVPVCPGYEDFLPSFAVVGPGLPAPDETVPFEIPVGEGALVFHDVEPGEERETFFEPFGGKHYYQGPTFEDVLILPGTYHVVFWDPLQQGGDYVAAVGRQEVWRLRDIIRALIVTPWIRQDLELHVDCD
jgi:hypothetical protein